MCARASPETRFQCHVRIGWVQTRYGTPCLQARCEGSAAAVPGNFIAGGGIGFIVDAGTGANMQLKPDPMRGRLAPIDSTEDSVVINERVEGGWTINKD
ncbi:MAG: hypothetical protein AAGL18_05615 [Pseudomonadota bacterium]